MYEDLKYGFRVAANMYGLVVREVTDRCVSRSSVESRYVLRIQVELSQLHQCIRRQVHSHSETPGTGSEFVNYKSFCSIVMLAIVDVGDYKFIWVDIGANVATSDVKISNTCD